MRGFHCHAGRDGDCNWKHCPQELEYKGHCPIDVLYDVYHDEDGFFKSDKHEEAWEELIK